MGWFNASARGGEDSFRLNKGFCRYTMQWSEVCVVHAQKIDKITYEELFLIFENDFGKRITVGELYEGFDLLEGALRHNIMDFPSNRRQKN